MKYNNSGRKYSGLDEDCGGRDLVMIETAAMDTWQILSNMDTNGGE